MAKKKETEEIEEVEDSKGKFIITEDDFKLESSRPNDPRFWDLYLSKIVNKGKPTERVELQLEGYGFQLETCLRKIATHRLKFDTSKRLYKSMREYLNEYKQIKEELDKLLNQLPELN